MADGRQIINETNKIVKEVSEKLEAVKGKYSEEDFSTLKADVDASLKWVKKCKNKVWLRSKEGTDLARGCLKEAEKLKGGLEDVSTTREAATSLSMQLESLAKIIASKASVMT